MRCPGCQTGIVLRLAVGSEPVQPFFYVCPTCKAATKGRLEWHGGAETGLILEAGERLDSEDGCTATVSINPDFPAVADAEDLTHPDGSAFIMHHRILGGDRLVVLQKNVAQLRGTVESSWADLRRLTTYYLNRDWKHFDQAAPKVAPPNLLDFSEPWKRDHALHALYDVLLAPAWAADGERTYPTMKAEWNVLWTQTRPNFSALVAFAKSSTSADKFVSLQKDLFDRVAQYVDLVPALIPGIVMNMYPETERHRIPGLRLFRDDFSALRDLYVQTFESCHRALRYVLGAVNADARGNADAFPPAWPVPPKPGQKSPKPPKGLDDYEGLVSALKTDWLALLPRWQTGWPYLLDRQLRNDIGHASIRHDLPSGMLVSDEHAPIPYTVFVQRTQRLAAAALLCLGVLKLMRVYAHHP